MWRHYNGGMMKLLAFIGVVLTTVFALILLDLLVVKLAGYRTETPIKMFITLFTLFGVGIGGAKYVGSHEIKKKDADG